MGYEGQGASGVYRGDVTCEFRECERESVTSVSAQLVDITRPRHHRYALCGGHAKQLQRGVELRPLRAYKVQA